MKQAIITNANAAPIMFSSRMKHDRTLKPENEFGYGDIFDFLDEFFRLQPVEFLPIYYAAWAE